MSRSTLKRVTLHLRGRKTAVVLAGFFAFVAAAAALLSRVSVSPSVLQSHPTLTLLERYRLWLVAIALISLGMAFVTGLWKEFSSHPSAKTADGRGEAETLQLFDDEMDDSLRDIEKRARDYYVAGVHDQLTGKLREAAANFKKSVDAVPTMGAYLSLGWCLWQTSELRDSQIALERGLVLAQGRKAHEREASILLNLGGVYAEMGQFDEALRCFEGVEKWSIALKDTLGRANAIGNIGLIYDAKGNYAEACRCHKEAFELHMTTRVQDAAIDLGNLGRAKMALGFLDEALALEMKALDLERSFPEPGARGSFKTTIAQILHSQSRFNEALDYAREAAKNHASAGSRHGEAIALSLVGLCLTELGRLDEAEATIRQSLAVLRAMGARAAISDSLGNLGGVLTARGKYAEAAAAFAEALDVIGGDNAQMRAKMLMNLGHVSARLARFAFANQCLTEALEIFEAANDRQGQARVHTNIGILAAAQRLHDEAESSWNRALELFRSIKDRHGEAEALNNLGGVEAEKGQNQTARGLFESALKILRPISLPSTAMTLGNIARTYWKDGDVAKAILIATEARAMVERFGPSAALDKLTRLISKLGEERQQRPD